MRLNERAANELRALRKARGLTLRGVSRLSGVSLTYLSEIERDKGNLSLDLLERLARVYDVDPLALLGGDGGQYARRMVAEARLARIAAIAEEG